MSRRNKEVSARSTALAPLAPRCRDAFDRATVRTAESSLAAGHVVIEEAEAGILAAQVAVGPGRSFTVEIDTPEPFIVRLECNCDRGEALEPCAHMYATLLAADAAGVSPDVPGTAPLDLIVTNGAEDEVFPAPDAETARAGAGGDEADDENEADEDDADEADDEDENDLVELYDDARGFDGPDDGENDLHEPDDAGNASDDHPREVAGAPLVWMSRRRPAAQPAPRGRRPAPVERTAGGRRTRWRVRLAELDRSARTIAVRTTTSALEPLSYRIDLARSTNRTLALRVLRRYARADGTLGTLRERSPGDLAREALRTGDRELVDLGQRRSGYYGLPYLELGAAVLSAVLPQLCASGRLGVGKATEPLRWAGEDAFEHALEVAPGPRGGARANLILHRPDERRDPALVRLRCGAFLVFDDAILRVDDAGAASCAELYDEPITVARREVDALVALLAQTPSAPRVLVAAELGWRTERRAPSPIVRFMRGERDARTVGVALAFAYGAGEVSFGAWQRVVCDKKARQLHPRDPGRELDLWQRLRALGVAPTDDPEVPGALAVAEVAAVAHTLLGEGFRVEAEGRRVRSGGTLALRVASGIDWFDLGVDARFDGTGLAVEDLVAALRRGERFVRLGDGSTGLLPLEWLERYGLLARAGHVGPEGALRFGKNQVALLDALLGAAPTTAAIELDETFARLRAEVRSFASIVEAAAPPEFAGDLRAYQRLGLGWLRWLERLGLHGCLADDMGLGKTVQVLAHLAGRGRPRAPSLVVAPKSLVANWRDEARRFAPGLRLVEYLGSERHAVALGEHDLVLTTYGTLRRSLSELSATRFDLVVLDEAQAIKNRKSQTARAARALVGDHRLALTGTPVENGLDDLASIFEFLNPGMIESVEVLRALGASHGPDENDVTLLRRALRPFLLRRTKEQVLPELPPKTEQIVRCPLGAHERRLYRDLLAHYRASLGRRFATEGFARSKMHVLEALLRLRQAACHPGLLDASRRAEPSAKLDALVAQLLEVAQSSHKALVFSQFTSFLAIVRARLEAERVPYAYLDGRSTTAERARSVRSFQESAAFPVFLISLRAGGFGLNLTAADYVFLLDPWWNPAVETQAIDRTHRIGQERPVFAYRFIAEDTVEDKVLVLQERKRALASELLGEESLLRALTKADLELLLS
ncbi:MAG: DEAD/DEAH box helicase [Myxococcales bacterium]|nr:DEAD/DEAH box helicase [Myxococcales bacterium]